MPEKRYISQQIQTSLISPVIFVLVYRYIQEIYITFIILSIINCMGQTCNEPIFVEAQFSAQEHATPVKVRKIQKQESSGKVSIESKKKQNNSQLFPPLHPEIAQTLAKFDLNLESKSIILESKVHKFNGLYYQGTLQAGKMNGLCRVIFPDHSYFQGTMKKNVIQGKGLLIHDSGDYYLGQFYNNKAEGNGVYESKDFRYQGQFKNNLQSGIGKMQRVDYIFEGIFENGKKKTGKMQKLLQNQIYQGQFQGNVYNGYGKLSKDNLTYEGNFRNGLLNGKGKTLLVDGTTFQGTFERGLRKGYGKIIGKSGDIISEGIWSNDKKLP